MCVWDATTGRLKRQWQAHVRPVTALAFADDGATLVTADARGELALWNPATGKGRRRLELPGASAVGIAGAGRWLIAGSSSGRLCRWEIPTGAEQTPPSVSAPLQAVMFVADGRLATVTDRDVRGWNEAGPQTGQVLAKAVPRCAATAPVAGVVVLAEGKEDTRGNRLRVLRADTGKELRTWPTPHEVQQVCCSTDGETIVSVGPKEIVVWDGRGKKRTDLLLADVLKEPADLGFQAAALSPDGEWLAFAAATGTIQVRSLRRAIWQIRIGEQGPDVSRAGWQIRVGDQGPYVSLAFSPDGRLLASVTQAGLLQLWEVISGRERLRRPLEPGHHGPMRWERADPKATPAALLFSPDSRWLAVGDVRRAACVLDVASGREALCRPGHRDTLSGLAWRADGQVLASASRDGTALLWDLTPLIARSKLPGPPARTEAALWEGLASDDGATAHRMIWELIADPDRATALLDKKLQQRPEKTFQQLLKEVDSPAFKVREQATTALKRRGVVVLPALRQKLAGKDSSLELRRRLEGVVRSIESQAIDPETVRQVRAVEVLEHLGQPTARAVLKRLAAGTPDTWLTVEALAALRRLQQPSSVAAP